jgi:hypothetical protein
VEALELVAVVVAVVAVVLEVVAAMEAAAIKAGDLEGAVAEVAEGVAAAE